MVCTGSCNDRHILHFPPTTWLNHSFNVFFNPPLPSFRQPHHSIFPKYCYLLEQGTLPGAFCSLPGNGNLSPLREIQKDRTKQPCKVARSAGYCAQITTGQPGWEHVSLVTKGKQHSHLIQKLPCLLLTNCGLSLEWCFQLVYSGAIPVENNPLVFRKHVLIKYSLPNQPHTYYHILWMNMVLFFFFNILFLCFKIVFIGFYREG